MSIVLNAQSDSAEEFTSLSEVGTNRFSRDKNNNYLYNPISFPVGGVSHTSDIEAQKSWSWENATLTSFLPVIMSISTGIYLLSIVARVNDHHVTAKYYLSALILTCLPFMRALSRKRYQIETVSAILLTVLIPVMERDLSRRQCLVMLRAFLMSCRVLASKSFFDTAALCLAYSSDAAALNAGATLWYFTNNFGVWIFFCVALLLLHVYKRIWHRVWEHTRILMILRAQLETHARNSAALVKAHLPEEVLADSSIEAEGNISSSPLEHVSRVEPGQAALSAASGACCSDALCAAAVDEGILLPFTHTVALAMSQLKAHSGLVRRDCALIALRTNKAADLVTTCNPAGNRAPADSFGTLLGYLAERHRVTCVRRLGNVWIGSVGCFKSWGSLQDDASRAVQFASEALLLGHSAGVAVAVDCGAVTGGFLSQSMSFELFGQEIRWLLMVLELRVLGQVVVSEAVLKQLEKHRSANPRTAKFKARPVSCALPWRVGSDVSLLVVDVAPEGRMGEFVSAEPGHRGSVSSVDVAGAVVDWPVLKALIGEHSGPQRCASTDPRYVASGSPSEWTGSRWRLGDSQPSLDQEIGEEFLLTATQRFQLSLNDPVFASYTDQELYAAQQSAEQKLYAAIRRVCFPRLWQLLCLHSDYRDGAGYGEYPSVLDLLGTGEELQSDALPGPLHALFGYAESRQMAAGVPIVATATKQEEGNNRAVRQKPGVQVGRSQTQRSWRAFMRRYKYAPARVFPIAEEAEGEDENEIPNSSSVSATERASSVSLSLPVPNPLAGTTEAKKRCSSRRSWSKYSGDARMFMHDSRLNGLATLMFYVTVVLSGSEYVTETTSSVIPSLFLCAVSFHLFLVLVLERRYDAMLTLLTVVVGTVYLGVVTIHNTCISTAVNADSEELPEYGDLGGELMVSLPVVFLVPNYMRQHAAWSYLNVLIAVVFSLLRRLFLKRRCKSKAIYRSIAVYALLLLAVYNWGLYLITYVSYLLEHKLLPQAADNADKEKAQCRALLRKLSPHVHPHPHCELYLQKRFRNAAVVALHVKVADQIAHCVDPQALQRILAELHRVVARCATECGVLLVSHFAGVYVLTACRDRAWDSVETLRFPDSHTARAVVFARTVRAELSRLGRELGFSVPLSVGINHGPGHLGFLSSGEGCSRFNYDMCGPVRDLAAAIASFHDGTFVSDAFDADVRRLQAPEEVVRDVTPLLDSARRREQIWFRVDGRLNGIELEDFKYLCMLGRGGYGSVHLLAEKHTGVPYAIKAIELKQESKLSKMIERECSILQMVNHPNVVSLKYSFRSHNRLYLVMSYVRGGNLKQVVERDKLGLSHMLMWFAELVLAVDYLHSLGIVHRDVKPANCMIGTDGHLQLGDFGLSKVVSPQCEKPGRERRCLEETTRHPESALAPECLSLLQKLLPLKSHTGHHQSDDLADESPRSHHRGITVLLITMDDARADFTLLFINTTVEVVIADYDIDADTVRQGCVEAIFIDGDYYEEDSTELVRHFASAPFGGVPVLLCAAVEGLRLQGAMAGARACSRLPLEMLTEETFETVCSPAPVFAFQDPLCFYQLDLIVLQETRAQQAQQGPQEAAHPSQHAKQFDQYVGPAERGPLGMAVAAVVAVQRQLGEEDMVSAVEDRSHTVVGTLHFIAPEVIRLRKYGKAVDWWACGVTFYECLVRKHLFRGGDKKAVFESITSAPIMLDELTPFGEDIKYLISGLLSRDIKRRLGSYGAEPIKQHKVFEKLDWSSVSTSHPVHKPAQFVNKMYRVGDKELFYGPHTAQDASLRPELLEQRNNSAMERYALNRQRAKKRHSRGTSLAKLQRSLLRRSQPNIASTTPPERSRSSSRSWGRSSQQLSVSLEILAEALTES